MKNMTMIPAMTAPMSAWQPTLSASFGCATGAFATRAVVFVPSAVAIDAVKRERAYAGTGRLGINAAHVLGSPAWSPPI